VVIIKTPEQGWDEEEKGKKRKREKKMGEQNKEKMTLYYPA